jgi:methionine-rich copper-binding protein CopC
MLKVKIKLISMNRKVFIILGFGLIFGLGLLFIFFNRQATAPIQISQTPPPQPNSMVEASKGFQQKTFQNIKAQHYVSSEPANNALLSSSPSKITIHFNFDLAAPSKITVSRDGKIVSMGGTTISADKLALSVPLNANQTGNYEVKYTACWPDRSCHEGSFGFSVKLP